MVTRPGPAPSTLNDSASAIRLLTRRGYDATTAEGLAEAIGMSRSTFFRRFGSKDDVVFADHDHALAALETTLATSPASIGEALTQGTADVLRLLIRDPEAARLRLDLMRRTPALRDRELVITHRYQRVFERYLRGALPGATPAWVIPSVSAGVVAIHNRTLRDWLRGAVDDAPTTLVRDLREFTSRFAPWLAPEANETAPRVLVAVYDADGTPEQVLDAVAAQLGRSPHRTPQPAPALTCLVDPRG